MIFLDQFKVIKTAENCSENNIFQTGDLEKVDGKDKSNEGLNEKLFLPIIGAAIGFCLIVLITIVLVYYCKVVREKPEIKDENSVYGEWNYEAYGDNYVKDANSYYDRKQ